MFSGDRTSSSVITATSSFRPVHDPRRSLADLLATLVGVWIPSAPLRGDLLCALRRCPLLRPLGFGSLFGHRQGSPQVSHVRFPSYLLDLRRLSPYRYGVNRLLPALPESSPHIQFLFVRLTVCYRLPSSVCYLPDSAESLILPSIGRTMDFHHIDTRALLSTQQKRAPRNLFLSARFVYLQFFRLDQMYFTDTIE